MEVKNNTSSSKFFGDAVVTAFITGLGYIVTSSAENSYLKYFGVSATASLVKPPITEIISVTLFICAATVFCLFVSKTIYKIMSPKTETTENIQHHLLSVFIAYYIPFMFIKIWLLQKLSVSMLFEFSVVILLFSAIIVVMVNLEKRSKKNKTEDKKINAFFLSSHFDGFLKEDSKRSALVIIVLLGLFFVLTFAPSAGVGIAKRRTTINTINTNPPLGIIAQYGDIFIAAPFDYQNKKFINQTHLINLNSLDERGLYLTQETVGLIEPSSVEIDISDKIIKYFYKIYEYDSF